ncbi:hypothetical protein DITRI_Ditri08aG0153800 [Diplodiscus trichospermus]
MYGCVGDECYGEQRLANNQKGIDEFKNLGEIEDVGPEKKGAVRKGVGREANDVVQGRWWVGDDGDGAAKGHDEGDEEESEGVQGCDGFQDMGSKGGERGSGEVECEAEVSDDCQSEKQWGGAKSLTFNPSEMEDIGMVHQPIPEERVKSIHRVTGLVVAATAAVAGRWKIDEM